MQDSMFDAQVFDAQVPGLLGRRAFWIGGALSVGCWLVLFTAIMLLA